MNPNFLTHFFNFARSFLVTPHTAPGPLSLCMSKSLYLSKFVPLANFLCLSSSEAVMLAASSKIWPNPPPWPPKHIVQAFPSNSDTRKISYHPTIQHGNHIFCLSRHGPIIWRRRVTAQESVVNTLQPENWSSSRFGPRIICLCLLWSVFPS